MTSKNHGNRKKGSRNKSPARTSSPLKPGRRLPDEPDDELDLTELEVVPGNINLRYR